MLLERALLQPSTAPVDQPNGPMQRGSWNEADEAAVSSIDRFFALDRAGTARGASGRELRTMRVIRNSLGRSFL